MPRPFHDRLLPACKTPAFAMEGYWIWCGSPIRGEDGRYHMFSSRWPKSVSMWHWATNSQIVRASADRAEGPYKFEEVVFEPRGAEFWDGRMTHCPTIHFWQGKYLLFYTGATYQGPTLAGHKPSDADWKTWVDSWHSKRVGLAVADSVFGPWKRPDQPVLQTRPGQWDTVLISNPAACVRPDGAITLLYKSTDTWHAIPQFKGRFNLGVAQAARWDAPFERVGDGLVTLSGSSDNHVEDPYIWWNGTEMELIMKDMDGSVCGEAQAGIHATSRDGKDWTVQTPAKAYSREVTWDDGTTSRQPKMERPQVLLQDGEPTHLFAATMKVDEAGTPVDTWSMVVPLG